MELPKEIQDVIEAFVSKRKKDCLFLSMKEISSNSVFALKQKLFDKHFDELDVILNTLGGTADDAYRIVKLLKKATDKINIFIPHQAKSAGTLISLSADTICLSLNGELGPLDVQLTEIDENGGVVRKSALEGFKALEQIRKHTIDTLNQTNILISNATKLRLKDIISLSTEFTGHTSGKLYEKIDPKKLGEYSRALDIGMYYGIKILHKFLSKSLEDAQRIMSKLVYGYPTHGFIIDNVECEELGLPIVVCNEVDKEMEYLNFLIIKFNILNFDFFKLFEYTGIGQDNSQDINNIGQ